MTHAEFVSGYRDGRLRVAIEPVAAGKYVSARLLLPLFVLPVLGCGVGLALIGWIGSGLAVLAVGILVPRLIKRSAPRFILTQAIEDERIYCEATAAGILRIEPVA